MKYRNVFIVFRNILLQIQTYLILKTSKLKFKKLKFTIKYQLEINQNYITKNKDITLFF